MNHLMGESILLIESRKGQDWICDRRHAASLMLPFRLSRDGGSTIFLLAADSHRKRKSPRQFIDKLIRRLAAWEFTYV